ERREVLLDAAKALVLSQGTAAVSVGAVAERSEVTRTLVYKHFANKEAILRALYHREASHIDRLIVCRVAAAADGFEPKFRVYVAGIVEYVADAGPVFAPLRAASADAGFATTQHGWDRRTVGYFADLAVARFGLDAAEARSAISLLLGGVDPLLRQIRRAGSKVRRADREERYVRLVLGALGSLAAG